MLIYWKHKISIFQKKLLNRKILWYIKSKWLRSANSGNKKKTKNFFKKKQLTENTDSNI